MNLGSFLDVLESGIKLSITEVRDNVKTELIKLFSGGQEQLTAELLAREVSSITIMGKSYLEVQLSAVS